MSRAKNCPIKSDPRWVELVNEHGGKEDAAMAVYRANGDNYPSHILALTESPVDTSFSESGVEFSFDVAQKNKEAALTKAINTIQKKVDRLARVPNPTDSAATGLAELQALLEELNEYEADLAITTFIRSRS